MPAPRVRDPKTAYKLVQARRRAFNRDVAALAKRLHVGDLTITQWHQEMRQNIKDLHVSSLVISRGGEWDTITQAEWGRVGRYLRDQYGYLNTFAEQLRAKAELAAMNLDTFQNEKYIAARSALYGGNANATFWRGVTYGLLPQVPGDGQTICRTNCGCHLEVEAGDTPDTLHVFWRINVALENCEDCVRLAAEWNPYVVALPAELMTAGASLGLDVQRTVMRAIRVDAGWFAGLLHITVHEHREVA